MFGGLLDQRPHSASGERELAFNAVGDASDDDGE